MKVKILLPTMRLLRLVLPLLCLLGVSLPALAVTSSADAPHVHVQLVMPRDVVSQGESVTAGLYFKLEPGWHVYWKNAGDAGEPPHMRWTLPAGITAGALKFPAPKRLPLGPLMDYGYEDEVLFPFPVDVAKTAGLGTVALHAKVDWLVCQNSCIPGKAELEMTREVSSHADKSALQTSDLALFKRLGDRLPKQLPAASKLGFQATPGGFRLTFETGRKETEAVFFPEDQDIVDNPAPQKLIATSHGFTLELKKDASLKTTPAQLRGVLELSGGRAYEITASPGLAAAVVGGVSKSGDSSSKATGTRATVDQGETSAGAKSPAAAVEPATAENPPTSKSVEPAQSSAVSAQGAGALETAPASGAWILLLRASGLAFLGGLLLNLMPCVFPVLFLKGLSLAQSGQRLQSSPDERNELRLHGLVYAAGILASFWVLVGVLLGLRAAGSVLGWGFQFQSPIFLSLMAGLLFFLGLSLAGQFEIGLSLTSKGGSLAQKEGYAGSFFTGVLAVVVATPCTAPLMGAAVGYALSQSVLVTFAVFTMLALGLAAPYVALTLQPAWTRLMPRPGAWMEVLKQATAVPIFATVIWLAWVLAQAYGANTLSALMVGFLLLAIAGWFLGRWPAKRWATVVAGVFLLGVVALAVYGSNAATAAQAKSGPEAGQAATSAAESGWQPWSAEAVKRAQAAGRPVFVDFTAAWCLSCQVNERVALQKSEVEEVFRSGNVLLLKADWTRHDEDITQALTAMGRSGVPTYALYAPGDKSPQLLPEALTPGVVLDALGKLPSTKRVL
jgi:thiol:disulfide interchange protein DsbD